MVRFCVLLWALVSVAPWSFAQGDGAEGTSRLTLAYGTGTLVVEIHSQAVGGRHQAVQIDLVQANGAPVPLFDEIIDAGPEVTVEGDELVVTVEYYDDTDQYVADQRRYLVSDYLDESSVGDHTRAKESP